MPRRPRINLALDRDATERQAAYRALFRSELEEDAVTDIWLALSLGQPPSQGRFGDQICAAVGVKRTRKKPGRPAGKAEPINRESQTDFGF
jgi:putative transposase